MGLFDITITPGGLKGQSSLHITLEIVCSITITIIPPELIKEMKRKRDEEVKEYKIETATVITWGS